MYGYSDSDWDGDREDRKSTSGFVFTLGGAPVSWGSRKQRTAAVSTCEAEYRSLSTTWKEAMWLCGLASDMLKDIE